jgi:hypothetical protein
MRQKYGKTPGRSPLSGAIREAHHLAQFPYSSMFLAVFERTKKYVWV